MQAQDSVAEITDSIVSYPVNSDTVAVLLA